MPATLSDTLEDYVRFWNADPGQEQDRLAAAVFADEVVYHAVPGVFTGTEALKGMRPQFVEDLGAISFRPRRDADHHHDRARLPWELFLPNGTSLATGIDVFVIAPDGRIAEISVFVDRAPAGFEHDDAVAGVPAR